MAEDIISKDMQTRVIEAHLRNLGEEIKTAKNQANKDAIMKRQDELKRQLEALK